MKEYDNTGYFVSSNGDIHGKTAKILTPTINRKGYCVVYLSSNGKKRSTLVHRMVAIMYIPNPGNKPEVNHVDGVKTNNNVTNLEWVTTKENKQHAMWVLGHGYGENASRASITEVQAREVFELLEDRYRDVDIASKLGIPRQIIQNIRNKKSWKYLREEYNIPAISQTGMSDNTFLWICYRLQDGWTSSQIMSQCSYKKLSPQMISFIKARKMRPYLLKDFTF